MGYEATGWGDRYGRPAAICRLAADGVRWRVLVESWKDDGGYGGRFVFEPEGPNPSGAARLGPASLRGRSREEVVCAAHDLPERRMRELLHSLG